jgi:acyl-CoA reductase-like NAD-dependent aldehyde dehydrogenase
LTNDVQDSLMFVGGEFVPSHTDEWIESVDPATEEVIGRVPAGDSKDVDRAVTAAEKAFPAWASSSPRHRAEVLREFARRLLTDQVRLADIDTRDTGNTIAVARADVNSAAEAVEYYAGLAYETKGETVPSSRPGVLHASLRLPFGVVGRILPFNHPLMFAASKLAAPLAAGNTIIIKPSEQSPLSTVAMAELVSDVFPPGVVNVVTGLGARAGDALVRHPSVRRLAFIGSVPTGLTIQRAAAEVSVKHVTLELGGKNPMIVFPDADFDLALKAAVAGMNFSWQGQSCGSTSRLFLHEDVYDAGVERLREIVGAIRVGNPADPASQMGPVNSRAQYDKDLAYIRSGIDEGARLVTGGGRPQGDQFVRGFWLRPTVFADVTPSMRIFREEIFGPVLSVIPWRNRDEVVAMANSVEYGLTASVWSNNLADAFATAREVEAGYCWINAAGTHFPGTSFGGVKNSGIGREEGLEELLSYTELKTLHVAWH